MTTRRPSAVATAARSAVERLEERRLFAVTAGTLPAVTGTSGGAATVNAAFAFNNNSASDVVQFTTSVGNYRVELFPAQKPVTVTNFLNYVNNNRYDGTVIHRSDPLSGNPAQAPDIIQGGGYKFPGFAHVETFAPIVNEFTTNGIISNTRGTVAMAKTSDPNSATSEFFVNVKDTSADLDSTSNSGGFTVFGKVLDADLPVVDSIAALPRYNFGSPFSALPVLNYTDKNFADQVVPGDNNVVKTQADGAMTFTVSSSNPALVAATVGDTGQVAMNYGSGIGTATITVQATSLDGQSTASTTFDVNVQQFDIQIGGTTGNKSVSFEDTDGTVSTVTIKGAGTATVRFGGTELTQSTSNGKVTVAGTSPSLSLISIAGSDASTTITVTGKGGDGVTTLDVVSADAALKSFTGKTVALTGAITTAGAVNSIVLGSANGAALNLGGGASDSALSITGGDFVDTDIIAGTPIKSIKLKSDTGTDSVSDVITAPGIDSINIAGNASADISSQGEPNIRSIKIGGNFTGSVVAHQVVAMTVNGNMEGASIQGTHEANEHANAAEANQKQNQAIGKLTVKGAIVDSQIDTAGSVGSIAAASITNSRIFTGLLGQSALPTTLAQLSQEATLNSLKIKGGFINSNVAGRYFGKLAVGAITTANSATPFGFTSDSIVSLSGRLDSARFSLKKIETQADVDASALTLGDTVVRVL